MLSSLVRAPFEAASVALFLARNPRLALLFVEATGRCEDCQDRGICSEHLEVAQEVFFSDD